ncbi:hypothetical protein [Sphingobacterium hungaricum]
MKTLLLIVSLLFIGCGNALSPEGRSKLRDQKIQEEIDHLKDQNRAMQDSITVINEKLMRLQ